MLMNPGPATSTFRISEDVPSCIWLAIVSAILRGDVLAILANDRAIGLAISPCSGALVGENGMSGVLT